ncbi:unnamed protein product [Calicophoron daubneyi]|uniref:NADH dehydrogenase [ubiquinone] 1 alpha subcomplex subunit 2 n=1 Tax=Calicophoron daubneyi TaxID=300641 RepID=A0AAV2SYF8_CALDB
MSSAVKFGSKVKELRLLFSPTETASKGAREFITKHYLGLKNANPHVKFMIREGKTALPRFYVRYAYGKEAGLSLADSAADEILDKLKQLDRA